MYQDIQLIKEVLAGNNITFEKIIDKYKGYIFAIILNFIKDHNEAENIAQEVFLQIYISLPEYKFDNFKGWVSRIAASKAIDWKRKKKSKFREEAMESAEAIADRESIGDSKTPEYLLIQKENRENIRRLCHSIPSIYENVIIKFYFEEKSYEEIAKEEGTTVKTIEMEEHLYTCDECLDIFLSLINDEEVAESEKSISSSFTSNVMSHIKI